MPVDTRNKRASAIGIILPSRVVYPNPSGSSTGTGSGRSQTAYSYSGISATTNPVTPFLVVRGSSPRSVRGSVFPRAVRGDVPERLVR